jgi:cytochrome c553
LKLVRSGSRIVAATSILLVFLLVAGGRVSWGSMNPANFGLPVATYGTDNIPANGASATCVACHTVAPVSGKSSHFVHQTGRTTSVPDRGSKERLLAWSSTTALSKYGDYGSSPIRSVTGTAGELICESCHNLIKNEGGGNNLVESSFNWDARPVSTNDLNSPTTTLCEGCHVSGTLPGHHPMTGDPVSSGGTLTNDNVNSPFTRAFGTPAAPDNLTQVASGNVTPGSEIIYPGANKMICISCHGNGHTGYTLTGARILRRGWAGPSSVAPLTPTFGVVGAAADPAQRQFDKDSTGVNRLIPNWQPLCDACHKVDD